LNMRFTWGNRASGLACLCAVLAAGVVLTGCEDDHGDSSDTASATAATNTTASGQADAHFPDGLHPDGVGAGIIAGVFNSRITPVAGGSIVCLGDSITAGSYPGILAGLTGMSVSNQGRGGERSGEGAARAAGAIGSAKYVCILYGANDVINGATPASVAVNILSIVNTCKSRGATPIVGTLTPMSGSYARYAENARQASSAIRAMASSAGVSVANLEGAF
jgi:hypothetical protein